MQAKLEYLAMPENKKCSKKKKWTGNSTKEAD